MGFSQWIDEAIERLSAKKLEQEDALFIADLKRRRDSGSRKISAREVRKVYELDEHAKRGAKPGSARQLAAKRSAAKKRTAKVIPLRKPEAKRGQ